MDWQPIDGKHFPTSYVNTGKRLESTQCLLHTTDGRIYIGYHYKTLPHLKGRARTESGWNGQLGCGLRESDYTHFVEIIGPQE